MGGYVTGTRHHLLQEGARTITVGRGRPAAAAHPELAPVLLDGVPGPAGETGKVW